MKFLLLVLDFQLILGFQIECIYQFEKLIHHPSDCCNYPLFRANLTIIKHCTSEKNNICGYLKCVAEGENLVSNGTFDKSAIKLSFSFDGSEKFSSEWNAVFKESMDQCFDQGEFISK